MISAAKSRMERNNPMTPGSSRPGEERTLTATGISIRRAGTCCTPDGEPAPKSHQRYARESRCPHAYDRDDGQIPSASRGRRQGKAPGNGRLICTIVNEIEDDIICVTVMIVIASCTVNNLGSNIAGTR
jgi:hypothetical protein